MSDCSLTVSICNENLSLLAIASHVINVFRIAIIFCDMKIAYLLTKNNYCIGDVSVEIISCTGEARNSNLMQPTTVNVTYPPVGNVFSNTLYTKWKDAP